MAIRVGYQSKTLTLNFNWLCNTFIKCGGTKDSITLGDIAVDTDVWSDSNIAFLNDTGAVKKFFHEGLGTQVNEAYVFWPKASKTDAGVAGWYLMEDYDAEYPMNNVEINGSDSFCVTCVGGEEGVTVTLPSAL